jgi:hypothetical protein
MNNDSTHPARSADFLSRLHDGELTAGQRAHFESHRAHCADCRAAASEFEAALSLFRASTTSPPSADLAARILRGLESTTRRRPPFGVVFGINLKWAAAFSTALIAVIIGSAVVLQRDRIRSVAARETPIPVILQPQAAAPPTPAPPSEEGPRRDRPQAAKAQPLEARKEAPRAPAAALDSGAASAGDFAASPPPQPRRPSRRRARSPAASPPRRSRRPTDRPDWTKRRLQVPSGSWKASAVRERRRLRRRPPSPARPPVSFSFLSTGREMPPRSSAPARRSGSPTCAAASTS